MQILCFEDEQIDRLRPIIQARPGYAITSASFRLLDWLRRLPGDLRAAVRPYLRLIQSLDYQLDGLDGMPADPEGMLLVNARVAPSVSLEAELRSLADQTRTCVVLDPQDQTVLAARVVASELKTLGTLDHENVWSQLLEKVRSAPSHDAKITAFHWPHDVVKHHMAEMPAAMEWRLKHGDYQEIRDGLFVRPGVQIGDHLVVDSSEGPILLDEDVKVGPFCYLSGPVYAGPKARLIEHAALKDGVSLGHTVKIGGEVEASVIEPYTNKQHHGFLGHSYLGSWINLGAGTCNSDLKNTYGTINIQYGEAKVATEMQFLGCFVGDYAKTAINTSIFTGKVIGVCSMMYGFVTSNVPSYVNYARLFGQTSLLPADVMINTQRRMFERRNVEQRECDKQLIRDMYELSADERASVDQDIL